MVALANERSHKINLPTSKTPLFLCAASLLAPTATPRPFAQSGTRYGANRGDSRSRSSSTLI